MVWGKRVGGGMGRDILFCFLESGLVVSYGFACRWWRTLLQVFENVYRLKVGEERARLSYKFSSILLP